MATILVPAPPASAFNKNRPVSDLLQHLLKHFQHIEARLPTELHSNMTSRELSTENGAAKYIAHLTQALRSLHKVPAAAPIPIRRPAIVARPAPTIAIAAAAAVQPATQAGTRSPRSEFRKDAVADPTDGRKPKSTSRKAKPSGSKSSGRKKP